MRKNRPSDKTRIAGNSFSADQIGYFGKPTFTQETLQIEKNRNKRMDELGIKRFGFGEGKEDYTEDEKEAIKYIYKDEAVPIELADRIIKHHQNNSKEKPKMKIASPEYILIIIILTLLNVIQYIKNK